MEISVPSEIESQLVREAARAGIEPAEYAGRLIIEQLNGRSEMPPGSLADLFDRWDAEDATSDVAEIERRNREFDQLKDAMNRTRIDAEGPSTRMPWP